MIETGSCIHQGYAADMILIRVKQYITGAAGKKFLLKLIFFFSLADWRSTWLCLDTRVERWSWAISVPLCTSPSWNRQSKEVHRGCQWGYRWEFCRLHVSIRSHDISNELPGDTRPNRPFQPTSMLWSFNDRKDVSRYLCWSCTRYAHKPNHIKVSYLLFILFFWSAGFIIILT